MSPQPGGAGLSRWLERRRVRAVLTVLLAIEVAGFLFIVAGTHGWIVPLSGPTTTDFVSFYTAGALANAGTPALAYDHAAHLAAEEAVAGAGIRYQYFNYPPVYLLLCAPLAHLPYMAAFLLFETATLVFYVAVGMRVVGERSFIAAMGLLAIPVVFWNYGLGQNAFLTAGLFGAAMLLIDRRPVGAGLLLGAMCYKPQFGLLLPFALLAGGYWRAFAAAAASAAFLVLLSVALFGMDTWQAFLAALGTSRAMYASGRILFGGMANLFGAARLIGLEIAPAYGLQALASLIALIVVCGAWYRRRLPLPSRAAVLGAAIVVAAPLALVYDMTLTVIAGAWLLRDRDMPAASPRERVVLAVAYLAVAMLGYPTVADRLQLPVFPLAALAVFAVAAARVRRETAIAAAGSPRAHRAGTTATTAEPSPPASPPR